MSEIISSISLLFSSNQNQLKDKSDVHYFKLPYIGNLSHHVKNKPWKLCKKFCKENFHMKLAFNSFKTKNYFSYKDPIPNDFESFILYKFTCASCSCSYIGETCHHFKTRVQEHIKKDNKSQSICFKIIDKANSNFDLKIKEGLNINWRKPNLNAKQNHLALTLSLYFLFTLLLSVCFSFVFFCNSLSSIVFIISTLIISTFL